MLHVYIKVISKKSEPNQGPWPNLESLKASEACRKAVGRRWFERDAHFEAWNSRRWGSGSGRRSSCSSCSSCSSREAESEDDEDESESEDDEDEDE